MTFPNEPFPTVVSRTKSSRDTFFCETMEGLGSFFSGLVDLLLVLPLEPPLVLLFCCFFLAASASAFFFLEALFPMFSWRIRILVKGGKVDHLEFPIEDSNFLPFV